VTRPGGAENEVRRSAPCSLGFFYEHYLSTRTPVIFTGLSEAWPAPRKWTWAFLKKAYGATYVVVSMRGGKTTRMPLGRYIDYVQRPQDYDVRGKPYLRDWNFMRGQPELAKDFEDPFFADDWLELVPPRIRPDFRWIYIGPDGSGTRFHIDTSGTHAWLCQLIGAKRWIMYPPGEVPEEYLFAADLFRPNYARFPKLKHARRWHATLEPGEVIFVPYGWQHQVRNVGPSLSLTANYVDASNFVDCATRASPEYAATLPAGLESALVRKVSSFLERGDAEDRLAAKWERRWLRTNLAFTRKQQQKSLERLERLGRRLIDA